MWQSRYMQIPNNIGVAWLASFTAATSGAGHLFSICGERRSQLRPETCGVPAVIYGAGTTTCGMKNTSDGWWCHWNWSWPTIHGSLSRTTVLLDDWFGMVWAYPMCIYIYTYRMCNISYDTYTYIYIYTNTLNIHTHIIGYVCMYVYIYIRTFT